MAKHNEVGKLGENLAVKFLEGKGFQTIGRNFWRPYGEIDIISRENSGKYRFIEVKTVSHGTGFRGEENMHPQKIARLMRVIQTYLVSHGTVGEWQFDLVCVSVDSEAKTARIRHFENIILN